LLIVTDFSFPLSRDKLFLVAMTALMKLTVNYWSSPIFWVVARN